MLPVRNKQSPELGQGSSAMYISSRNTTGVESVRLQTHFARMTETANTSNRDDLTLTSAPDGRVRSGSKPESRLRMKTQQLRGGGGRGSVKASERQFQQGKNPPFVRKERSSARTPCTAAPPPSVVSSPRSTRPRCARGASSTHERSTPEDPSTQPGGSWMNRRVQFSRTAYETPIARRGPRQHHLAGPLLPRNERWRFGKSAGSRRRVGSLNEKPSPVTDASPKHAAMLTD